MREGILAPQTDYASRPLRDHLKRKNKCIVVNFLSYTFLRGRSESKSNVSASARECLKDPKTADYPRCIRKIQVLF